LVEIGSTEIRLFANPPSEEIALHFYDWLKAHHFKAVIMDTNDALSVNSAQGQVIVDALVNQFAEDMGAGRDDDSLEG
jgi:hypothetical protein